MGAALKPWRWALLLLAALIAGLVYAFWPQPRPVDTAPVTRGAMMVGITEDATTRVRRLHVVAAPISGYVEPITLEPGDPVKRGRMITHMHGPPSAPLDPNSQRQARAALAAASATTKGTEAALAQARRDLVRAEDLARSGYLPRARLEAARTLVATTAATLAQQHAEIARLRAQLADPTGTASPAEVPVRAPANGMVLSALRQGDAMVLEGEELMLVGDPQDIELVVELLSRDAVQVQPGAEVRFSEWGGDAPLIGKVKRIEPLGRTKVSALGIEEQRVDVIVGFDIGSAAPAARLGHGFQLEAMIVLWQKPDVLRVPIGALFRGPDGGWQLFVVSGGRARLQTVKVGQINDEQAEVLQGLTEGQSVILNPGSAIADGVRVRPR